MKKMMFLYCLNAVNLYEKMESGCFANDML